MKKYYLFLFIFIVTFAPPIFSQYGSSGIKIGFQSNFMLPENDFNNDAGLKSSLLLRGSLRLDVFKWLQAELGAGVGQYSGLARHFFYASRIVPIDFRLIYIPFDFKVIDPYLYGGIGVMQYEKWFVEFINDFSSPGKPEPSGWCSQLPLGFGLLFKISEYFALDFNIGACYTNTDDLDYYYAGNNNDYFYSAGLGLLYLGSNDNADYDNDGLSNGEEKLFLSDPYNPDTDNDGLNDGIEVNKYKTNPLDPDTDHDKIKDGDEVMIHLTDPNKTDSDGDGLSDGNEILKYKTNPSKTDTDYDGLSDYDEIMKYKTDPLTSDTDDDGLRDGEEILKFNTDPLNRDTDKDGLEDGKEVKTFKTNPLNPDTDGGTVNDGDEIARRTNPLDPNDDLPKVIHAEIGKPIVLESIIFNSDEADILPASKEILIKILNTLKYERIK